MKNKKLHLNAALGGILLSTISSATIAQGDNPFQAKALPQGYLVAENTQPDPQPPAQAGTQVVPDSQLKVEKSVANSNAVQLKKTIKSQDGGCGAGSCAAKINKAKNGKLAK